MSTLNPEKNKTVRARRKRPKWVGPVIILLTLAGIAAAAISTTLYLNRETAEVVPAVRGKAIAAVYGTVKVEWAYIQAVKAEVTGYIQFADDIFDGPTSIGYVVTKGRRLGTITDEATSRAIQTAKNNLQAAESRKSIGSLYVQPLKQAEDNFARLKKLKELGNVADAQLKQAELEVTRLKDQIKAEEIEINRMVTNLTQDLNTLMEKQRKAEVICPMDGILTGIGCTNGEKVFENNPVFTIAQNRTYLSGQVNEEDVGSLQKKMAASIRLYSFPNQEFTATVASIQPTPDQATQRYPVILNFDAGSMPANLMAGMTGEMNVILGERDNAIIIPTSALMENKVYIVKDDIVVPRDVQIGYRSMERVEILSGIEAGDLVIRADQDKFRPGERVRPLQVNTIRAQ